MKKCKRKKKLCVKGFTKQQLAAKYPREFAAYEDMIGKCYDPDHPRYQYEGARGIRVCDRWLGSQGFHHFMEDMGEAPSSSPKATMLPY